MSGAQSANVPSLRQLAPIAGLLLSFLIACHFYGVGFNMSFLWLSTLGPLVIWTVYARTQLARLLQAAPVFVGCCLASLLLIAIHHLLFSVSPDSSFAPSWVLACIPLWALVARFVDTQLLVKFMSGLVFIFAAMSSFMFLGFQERASAPLPDPNNYVTLLYLAWIPWLLRHLAESSDLDTSPRRMVWFFLVSWCVGLSLFATESRFSLLVVSGVCVISLAGVWRFKFDWRQCAIVWVAGLFALVVYLVLGEQGLAASFAETAPLAGHGSEVNPAGASSSSQGVRWHLLQSTWQAMLDFGGLNGTGLFTFSLFYPGVRALAEQETAGQFVHNDFVQLALEGGVWFVLPLLVLLVFIAAKLVRGVFLNRTWDNRLGFTIAIAVALVHAGVNFVLYVLPLTVMLGVWMAAAFGGAKTSQLPIGSMMIRSRLIWVLLGVGLLTNSLYLALDSFTYGVFSNQLHVPFAREVRTSPERMLGYARFAQQVNGDRGIPVLGEAKLLELDLQRQTTLLSLAQARAAFERSIAIDPWNPMTYTSYYLFLQRFTDNHAGNSQTEQLSLLNQALSLDPSYMPAARLAVDYHVRRGDLFAAATVANEQLVWCDLFARRRRGQFNDFLKYLDAVKRQFPELAFNDSFEYCHMLAARELPSDGRSPTWLMRWLREQSLQ